MEKVFSKKLDYVEYLAKLRSSKSYDEEYNYNDFKNLKEGFIFLVFYF